MLASAKVALRKHAPGIAYFIKTLIKGRLGQSKSPAEVFSAIYATGEWGGDGAMPHSGSGSDEMVTGPFVDVVRSVIADYAIKSVLDLGCGDYRVGQQLADLVIDYTGVDVVAALVARNNAQFASERVRFVCADITRDALPDADLCIVRQVLQHLSNAQIAEVLKQIASFRYVIVAEHHPARLHRPNLDKNTGADTRIDFDSGVYLEHPPFEVVGAKVIATTPLPSLLRDGEYLTIYLIDRDRQASVDG